MHSLAFNKWYNVLINHICRSIAETIALSREAGKPHGTRPILAAGGACPSAPARRVSEGLQHVDNQSRSAQEPERKEVFPMYCRYCNAELMAGAVFCAQCGKPVAAGTAEVSSDED